MDDESGDDDKDGVTSEWWVESVSSAVLDFYPWRKQWTLCPLTGRAIYQTLCVWYTSMMKYTARTYLWLMLITDIDKSRQQLVSLPQQPWNVICRSSWRLRTRVCWQLPSHKRYDCCSASLPAVTCKQHVPCSSRCLVYRQSIFRLHKKFLL